MIIRLKDVGERCPCCGKPVQWNSRQSGTSGGARCKMDSKSVRLIVHTRDCKLLLDTHEQDMLAPTGRVVHRSETHPAERDR